MSFVSIAFLFFLPIVFSLYWLLQRQLRLQNLCVLLASYVFYGWWDWRFLILIIITSASSYFSGLLLTKDSKHPSFSSRAFRRWVVFGNICLNIGILGFFKYYGFFAENLVALFSLVDCSLDAPTLNIILPVGISFYTFQSLSYTFDVYREKIPATRDVIAFFAFIAFFPQLVAGPIERAANFLPQMLQKRVFVYSDAVDGLKRILWGFFKKMVVADNCAIAVNAIWADYTDAGAATLLVGMVLFTFQIYCDFSGYSDIAIGTAKLFGIRLMENFSLPYFSRSMGEFWRKWHISLMTWLRDYVYIPLGGSRVGKWRTAVNIIVVFLLSGLWHGANWTFVAWGGYNALLLVVSRLLLSSRSTDVKNCATWRDIPSVLMTFILVALGWVVFRSVSITEACDYLSCMFVALAQFNIGSLAVGKVALFYCALLVALEWIQRHEPCPLCLEKYRWGRYSLARWVVYYVVFFLTFFCKGEEQTFIYFQF